MHPQADWRVLSRKPRNRNESSEVGIGDGMHAFKATRYETVAYSSMPSGQGRGHRFQAPGRVVMVLHEGSGWVRGQGGTIEVIRAKSVVTWDEGEWIEYGSDGSCEFKAELYWSAGQRRAAAAAGISGPSD
jgi:hypothetical protein